MRGERVVLPVQTEVTAKVGPIVTLLHEPARVLLGGWQEPDYAYRPWAVTGWCWVTFQFGDGRRPRVVSKGLRSRHQFSDEPTADEVAEARRWCEAEIRRIAAVHGLALSDDHPVRAEATDQAVTR